jgi:hypothetical protein
MAQTVREAVAVFDDPDTLEAAVFALETHGFDRAAFSLLADEATVERKLGQRYRRRGDALPSKSLGDGAAASLFCRRIWSRWASRMAKNAHTRR